MNLGAMQTALERYGFDVGDPLSTWLNAAMHEIESAFDWPFLEEGPVTLQIPAGSNALVLPGDAIKVISIYDLDHLAKIKYWNRHKFRRMIQDQTDVGLIEIYTLINTATVQVWRVPQIPTNIEVVYQAAVPDMVAQADVPGTPQYQWPAMMHYPIVMRAASIALQAENEEDRAKTAQDEYQRSLLACMGKFGERQIDEPETVEDAQGYLSDMPLRGIAGW